MKLAAAALVTGVLAAGAASAANIDLFTPVPGGPSRSDAAFEIGYVSAIPGLLAADFFGFSTDVTINISLTVDPDGGVEASSATDLTIVDGLSFETIVQGELEHVALDDGSIRALFSVTEDRAGDGEDWGGFVLATLAVTGFAPSTEDLTAFESFTGEQFFADATFAAVQPVPLPAALPMLAGGIALLGAVARRRR